MSLREDLLAFEVRMATHAILVGNFVVTQAELHDYLMRYPDEALRVDAMIRVGQLQVVETN